MLSNDGRGLVGHTWLNSINVNHKKKMLIDRVVGVGKELGSILIYVASNRFTR